MFTLTTLQKLALNNHVIHENLIFCFYGMLPITSWKMIFLVLENLEKQGDFSQANAQQPCILKLSTWFTDDP